MKFKCENMVKKLILNYIFMSLEIHLIHTYEQKIQLFRRASDVFGKASLEAEMAYFTQKFYFVNDKDEWGESMLNFWKKYLEMQNGYEVSQYLHWKNEKDDVQFIYRGNHCHSYLDDDIFIRSGIRHDPLQLFVKEEKHTIKLDYYTDNTFNFPALQCRVKVQHQSSTYLYIYFMNFTNVKKHIGYSYFVLASTPTSKKSELSIIMYRKRRIPKFNGKQLLEVGASLQSVDEDSELSEPKRPTISKDDPIVFRKLLIITDSDTKAGNSRVVLFGKDAERLFITSGSFHFLNPELKNSYVDRFIQLVQNMKKGQEILFALVTHFRDAKYRAEFCTNSINRNATLQFHNIIPDNKLLSKIKLITDASKIIFPRTNLPKAQFQFPMLTCPALVGDEKKPIIIYVQFVSYFITRGKHRTFALLKSHRVPGAIYPVTLMEHKYDFSDPSVRKNIKEQVPLIYEDEELGPVIEEPTAEASTSSVDSLLET